MKREKRDRDSHEEIEDPDEKTNQLLEQLLQRDETFARVIHSLDARISSLTDSVLSLNRKVIDSMGGQQEQVAQHAQQIKVLEGRTEALRRRMKSSIGGDVLELTTQISRVLNEVTLLRAENRK